MYFWLIFRKCVPEEKCVPEGKYLQANYLAGICIGFVNHTLHACQLYLKNKTVHAAKKNTHTKIKNKKLTISKISINKIYNI